MNRFQLYTVVVLPAAVLMALEMVSSRILAPHFGSSVYVWGSIIGVFLAAMSIGYYWGGWLADRRPQLGTLGLLLLGSASGQAVVLLAGEQVTAWFGQLTQGSPAGTLLVTSLLFGPPTICLATVSPYAIRLVSSDLAALGGTAGHLYALSTAGSLVGTLGATFVLIPNLDLGIIFRLLLLLTLASAAIALFADSRLRLPVVGVGALLLVALVLPGSLVASADDEHVLLRRMTAYQTLELHDIGGVRSLYSDGALHAAVRSSDGETALGYARHATAALLLDPRIESTLVLGMGSGAVGNVLKRGRPSMTVEYVEIDPAVVDIAREHMFLEAADEEIFVDDGRRFLARHPDRRWDFIYADTFIGYSIPFHMTTQEFFREAKDRLEPLGILGLNLPSNLEGNLPRSILRTLRTVFRHVLIFETAGNHLFLATDLDDVPDRLTLIERGRALDQEGTFRPSLEQVAGQLLAGGLDLSEALLLTDRYAPVNHLLDLERKLELADSPDVPE